MRLIDADELKKKWGKKSRTLTQIINNAPTVEIKPFANITIDEEKMKKYVEQAKAEILAEYKIERTQGEWKSTDEIFITEDGLKQPYMRTVCSNCNQANAWGDVPFCPWCGAEMRGNGNEVN